MPLYIVLRIISCKLPIHTYIVTLIIFATITVCHSIEDHQFPYFFTLSMQSIGFCISMTIASIFLCLFAGFCRFAVAFTKDTEDSLREINTKMSRLGKDFPRNVPLLHRAVLREKLCVIMRFQRILESQFIPRHQFECFCIATAYDHSFCLCFQTHHRVF